MIGDLLRRMGDPAPLTSRDARAWFDRILAPDTSEPERVGLLLAATVRAATGEELAHLAAEMRRRAVPFEVPASDRALDLCGSGGAPVPSFNVSTVAAFVVSGAGAAVAKHGNRSVRGPCGSSDLLTALGLPVETSPAFARASYRRTHLAFLHAPLFHPATRAVADARRTLGAPTVFNRLGPLSNPARPRAQVVGVVSLAEAPRVATALRRLGARRGVAMTSDEGCDEFSPRRPTRGIHWSGGVARRWTLRPETLLDREERRGDWGPLPPAAAAEEAERILAGGDGARRGSVLLTAGAALWVGGRAPTLGAGVRLARESLDTGRAEDRLRTLRAIAAPPTRRR